MGILNIRPATRSDKVKFILGIAGPSGSGKTYTALKIARGMVSSPEKIGFLDTENGRGSLYHDILDGKFQIADLYAPFSPSRYSDAIKEFQAAGVEVLVIDSVSHEWEGEGGCDDIANAPLLQGKKMANWKGAKSEHKKFMQTLLYANMHIIVCLRAREKTSFTNPTQPVSLGIQPVCEKNFMFELTASILMENEGTKQTPLKVPSFMKKAFGGGDRYLGETLGQEIIKWISLGTQEHPDLARLKSEALMACDFGLVGLTEFWNKLTPEMQEIIKPHIAVFKASAKEVDKQSKEASSIQSENSTVEAKSSDSDRIIKAIKSMSTMSQLEASKGSFDMSDPDVKFAYDDKVIQLTK